MGQPHATTAFAAPMRRLLVIGAALGTVATVATTAQPCRLVHGTDLLCDHGSSLSALPDLRAFDGPTRLRITDQPGLTQLIVPSSSYSGLVSLEIGRSGVRRLEPTLLRRLPKLRRLSLWRLANLTQAPWSAFARPTSPLNSLALDLESVNCSQCSAQWLGWRDRLSRLELIPIPGSNDHVNSSVWVRSGLPETLQQPCARPSPDCERFQPTLALGLSPDRVLESGERLDVSCAATFPAASTSGVALSFCLSSAILDGVCDRQHLLTEVRQTPNRITGVLKNTGAEDNVWISCQTAESSITPAPVSVIRPIIVESSPEVTLQAHGDAESRLNYLYYSVTGFPPPNITWTRTSHDGVKTVIELDKHKFQIYIRDNHLSRPEEFGNRSGFLHMQDNIRSQHGVYVLRACNGVGNCSSASASLGQPRSRLLDPLLPPPPPGLATGTPHPPDPGQASTLWWVGLGLVNAAVLAGLVLVPWRLCQRRKKRPQPPPAEEMLALRSRSGGMAMADNEAYGVCPAGLPPGVPLLALGELQLLAELGEGAFGKVFLGEAPGHCFKLEAEGSVRLAAKKLKLNSPERVEGLRKEAGHLASLSHPNIVSFYGVCWSPMEPSIYLLFEYMEQGDLRHWIQERGPDARLLGAANTVSTSVASSAVDETPTSSTLLQPMERGRASSGSRPSAAQLTGMAAQVAEGLRFLSERHFVHRDLAARNCLVSEGPIVKVSDFGMSRDIYCEDYYRVEGHRLLPIRWMAVEGFLYGRFGTSSDVWSFGVLLWELFSFGKQPWYGRANHEVIERVKEGGTLEPPSETPDAIKTLMKETWAFEADKRPSPTEILKRLRRIQLELQ